MTANDAVDRSSAIPRPGALTKFVGEAPPSPDGAASKPSPVREFLRGRGSGKAADGAFGALMLVCACTIFAIVIFIATILVLRSRLSLAQFGWKFFTGSSWDPVSGDFGALPFIFGTLATSLLALLMAVPLALGVAIFLTELCPRALRAPISFLTELLAAIPSVVYGLWAVFVLVPLMRDTLGPWLSKVLGWTKLFEGPNFGVGLLTASIILAIMILPIISSITRDIMLAVPSNQREAMLALGATRWEMIRTGVLRNARIGIVGAVILGLGRALGETMAVTMVIGNSPQISKSLFAPGYTLASVIANEFAEASGDLYLSALIEIGLALFLVTIVVNAIARLLVWAVTRGAPARWLRMATNVAAPMGGEPVQRPPMDFTTRRMRINNAWRNWMDRLVTAAAVLATALVIAPLAAILFYLIYKGASSLNLDFFTKVPAPVGQTGGGMANSIVGSGIVLALCSAMGIPIGIAAGVYLAEYGRGTLLGNAVRFTADVLNGVPSIVMGIAVYALIVMQQKHFSAFSGGVALAIMMIPTVTRTTEEMLATVPHSIREAALGLGVPRWRTTISVALRTASPGIITGCMLAFARVAGETAPLLFTALGNQFWSVNLNQPIAALPLQIYTYATSPYDEWHRLAWAGSLVLIVLIMVSVTLVRIFAGRGALKGGS